MVRNVIGLIVGLTTAYLLVIFIQMVPTYLFPPPGGVDLMSEPDEARAHYENLPFMAYFLILMAYLISSFCGSWVLNRISESKHFVFTTIFFVIFFGTILWTISGVTYPTWMVFAAVALVPIVTFIGHVRGRISTKV